MSDVKLCINCEHCFKKDYSQVYWCKRTEKTNLVDGSKYYNLCEYEREKPFDSIERNCGIEAKFYYDYPF